MTHGAQTFECIARSQHSIDVAGVACLVKDEDGHFGAALLSQDLNASKQKEKK